MPPEAPFLHAAQLEAAWLTRVDFRENPSFQFGQQHVQYSLSRSSHHQLETADVGGLDAISAAVYRLAVAVGWILDGVEVEPGSGLETPFDLEVEVAGRFTWEESQVDREFAEGWLDFNATYLLWPYVRAQIASITAASSSPSLTIYTLQVPRPHTSAPGTSDFDELEAAPDAEQQGPTL